MDLTTASGKLGATAKTARALSAEWINQASAAADAAAPLFAPFAARWNAEADRRKQLRTPENLKKLIEAQRKNTSARATLASAKAQREVAKKAKPGVLGALSTERRAANSAAKSARAHAKDARRSLREARRNHPDTLASIAARAHAAHAVPGAVASYAMSTPADWTMWPASTSLALITANVAALWLGRRKVTAAVDEEMTAEERRLAARLDPSWWAQNAEARGLDGTLPTPAKLTPAGLVSHVRLDERWTPPKFRAKADEIRALLGARTDLRIDIKAGSHGDRATIKLRTRQAVEANSLVWTPESKGVGIDLETGEPVVIPIEGTHKGIAAATGMGKSTFWRPWMMEAVANPLMAGMLLDPKRQEARQWRGKIRTEGHQKDGDIRQYIYDGVCELEREMRHRQSVAEVTQWVPTPEYPILLVVIEEMANVVRMSKDKRWSDILDKLDALFSEARAAGIWFVWATQFPSRSGGGITPQIAENTLTTVALTTEGATADAVIFGNDGPPKGWRPSELGGVPGRALIKHKGRPANPIQGWYVTDEVIKALPDVEVWRHKETRATNSIRPALCLVKDEPAAAVPTQPSAPVVEAGPATNRDKVLAAIWDGACTGREITDRTGLNKGTVSREIKALVESSAVRRVEDGTLTARREAA